MRKAVIVFSNGPDDASTLSPDEVRRVAEDEGIPIYVISTNESNPISNARTWQTQSAAFGSTRDNLANSYLTTRYPEQNPDRGFVESRWTL
jgi:hypothetical protein